MNKPGILLPVATGLAITLSNLGMNGVAFAVFVGGLVLTGVYWWDQYQHRR